MTLSWNWNGQSPLLTKISDEQTTLCSFTYEYVVTMTLWPGTNETSQIVFRLINGDQLNVVSRKISDTETLKWYFEYFFVEETQSRLLNEVRYPTGKIDTVVYSTARGLKFPERSGMSHQLPAVLSLNSNPGGGQPKTTTHYEYTPHNFLGYNSNFGDWSADSDYIYTTLTNYTYGSTETVSEGARTVSIVRTYNNYHLQTSEKTTCQKCVTQVDFSYYAKEGYFIDSQPKQFQLLREKKETWTDERGISRTQSTLTEFDESGNPINQVTPDGTTTTTTWYTAAGEEGCPREPNGFVRFMKKQAVTPRKTDYDAPTMTSKYIYAAYGQEEKHIVQDTVSDYADDVLIHKKNFVYNSTNWSEYGRIVAIVDSKYEKGEKSDPFVSHQAFQTVVKDGILDQKTTFTGHDGIQITSARAQSAFSGLLLSETNTQGVSITHVYDKLGRLLKKSVAPGTDYEAISTWTYAIEGRGPVTTQTNNSGNQIKVFFDGSGREVSTQRLDKDRTQRWFEVSSQTHDVFGEISKVTTSDWRTDTNARYDNQTTFSYDGWGSPTSETSSDRKIKIKITNPAALTEITYMQADKEFGNIRGGTYTTTLDRKSLLPSTETRTDSSGREEGRKTHEYDGLGRLRQETDELDRVIKRSYDVYGRVHTQALPDGSVVTRTYAPHLVGEQVSSISVAGPNSKGRVQTWILGTQEFDSLGRVKKRTCGDRTTTYEYDGASPDASAISLPSGERMVYTYIPELGNKVSSLTAKGVTQKFSYDKKTGQMVSAKENDSYVDNTWSNSGLLTEENFSQNGKTQKTKSIYTLSGKPISYTDVISKQMQYTLDSLGRPTRITDDALTVDLKYDPLGRLSERKVSDSVSSSFLTTNLAYDDFGRETSRTIKNGHQLILKVSQTWQKNGILATRTTSKDNTKIRDENYTYDNRNRLIDFNVFGTHLPVDSYGHSMTRQTYSYDALNNFTFVKTTLSDNTVDMASYLYENNKDPTQLTTVTHTHKSYPKKLSLKYDAGGRMISDEASRTLTYDVIGRLSEVKQRNGQSGSYSYDAHDRLISRNVNSSDTRDLYYRGNELVNEVTSQKKAVRLIKMGHSSLGVKDENGLTLTTADTNESLLWSADMETNAEGKFHVWSPYGSGTPDSRLPGFNGERIDPVSGTYHLGNGYRAYNPALMRFNCPDSLSPFGAGGINPYAYCAGDPVNHVDPSGHLSWDAIAGIILGVIGIGMAAFTAGASIAAAGGVMAAITSASATSLIVGGLGIASDVTAIVSGALEDSHPEMSATLGWVSLATGLAGTAVAISSKWKGKYGSQKTLREVRDGYKYEPLKFAGVHDAPIELRGNRPVGWYPTVQKEKFINFAPDTFIYGSDIQEPLDILLGLNDGKKIVIMSGSHGNRFGTNWVKRTDLVGMKGERTMMNPRLRHKQFLREDIRMYGGGRVRIKNVQKLKWKEYLKYIEGDYHVIMGFCYGYNDKAYRFVLGLDAVTSYVGTL